MATNVSEMEKAYSEAIEWLIAQALDEESQYRHGGELEYLLHFTRSDTYRDAADHLQHILKFLSSNAQDFIEELLGDAQRIGGLTQIPEQ